MTLWDTAMITLAVGARAACNVDQDSGFELWPVKLLLMTLMPVSGLQ